MFWALGILVSLIASTILGAFFIDNSLKDFENSINEMIPDSENDITKIYEAALKIEERYKKIEKFLMLFIYDDAINDIEEYIEDIKSSAVTGERSDAIMAKSRLILHVRQLRRLSGFSYEAIF